MTTADKKGEQEVDRTEVKEYQKKNTKEEENEVQQVQ